MKFRGQTLRRKFSWDLHEAPWSISKEKILLRFTWNVVVNLQGENSLEIPMKCHGLNLQGEILLRFTWSILANLLGLNSLEIQKRCYGQSPRRKFTWGVKPYTCRQNVGPAYKRRVNMKCQLCLTRENLHGMLNISAKRQFTWNVNPVCWEKIYMECQPYLLQDNLHGKSILPAETNYMECQPCLPTGNLHGMSNYIC